MTLKPLFCALILASPAASIERAKQLFDTAKYAEAKTELLALQKSAAAAYYLGRIATFDNDGDEAIRQFERAVELDDGNALYHAWLGNAVRDEAQHASAFKMPFMARRMKKEWERAVELDPAQLDARLGLVMFHAMAPGIMGGNKDTAREQAREIAKHDAMRGAMARGMLAEAEKNTAAEVAAYQEAIAAAPDDKTGYFALGSTYAQDGKATEAFATLDQYINRHPEDRSALYQAGRFAGLSGQQLDRGENALKEFLAAPPADAHPPNIARAHYWLGQIAEKRGAKDAAREHYRSALAIDPKSHAPQRALDALK